jgi:HD superfamily phosphohydrolase
MSDPFTVHIRDPIHGSILLTGDELALVETPVFQRLRGIKQLGFADHAFPGATHTRFAHSLGAMEMATRMFDAVFPALGTSRDADAAEGGDAPPLSEETRQRFRQLLRLAVLLHDIGHAPLSHATEGCMPLRHELGLECLGTDPSDETRANHEDYTTLLLLDSELTVELSRRFAPLGITPVDVANVITGVLPAETTPLTAGGIDYAPLLTQMVSGELDADRMDYLQRDSYHAGVDYGRFDQDWLLRNLGHHVHEGKAYLALYHRAIFAFEDFLLSRYHMFASVYYHHSSIAFDTMLSRYIEEEPEFRFPTSADEFVQFDDVAFWMRLRSSDNRWAKRIVRRDIYRRILELNAGDDSAELSSVEEALRSAGIDYYVSRDESVLSRYYAFGGSGRAAIFVVNRALGRARRVDTYSKLYERYAQPARLQRVYCRPDQRAEAQRCLRELLPRDEQLELAW